MRHTSAAAALLASAVIGGLGLTPAAAQATTGPPVARAAWIKSCTGQGDIDVPCGHWRLLLRGGGSVAVRAAAATTPDGGEPSRFALSADGRVMAYERARDRRLVVQRVAGGRATELPRITGGFAVRLSPKGDRVLIDRDDAATKVITVATGRTTTLHASLRPLGFSGDGDEVLATRIASDNTTVMYAYRLGGGSLRQTPPQVVAGALTYALAPDGRTVAVFTSGTYGTGKPLRVRTYDLRTGELSEGADLPLKTGTPLELAWWGAGRLTATVRGGEDGKPAVVRVLTVDPGSGAVTQADRYPIDKSRYTAILAGE
ncbi:hypothetical protein [Nonomuraea sp. NPDC002799]